MKSNNSEKGFTIIEVVVVLAIAGLIFGIVFWALPNLQKSNRDSARRTIAANVLANLDQHAANNSGLYPTSKAEVVVFLNAFYPDPDGIFDPLGENLKTGTNLVFDNTATGLTDSGATFRGQLGFGSKAKCGASGSLTGAIGSRAVAVQIDLEQGGIYCVDNN